MPNDVKANRKAWVDALRSGKYKQGKGYLRPVEPDGTSTFCCLGVACEVFAEQTGTPVTIRLNPTTHSYDYSIDGDVSNTILPAPVMEWLGLRTAQGDYKVGQFFDTRNTCLAGKNDGGVTFEEIADIIESEPPGLFVEEESTFAP